MSIVYSNDERTMFASAAHVKTVALPIGVSGLVARYILLHWPAPAPTLHPTFLSWLKNINALAALIDRVSELAVSAPQENRTQLNRQVATLRAGFKKQQERCVAYLQLTGAYAERFLSDISEEIQQQSSFLDALEKRLDMAKTLREEVVQLRKSYEVGTLDCIKKIRHTGMHTSHYILVVHC